MPLALVTGGAGFIGSHLVEGLLARDYKVRVLDNFSTGTARESRERSDANRIARRKRGELDDRAQRDAERGCRFSQAALPSVPRSVKNPLESNEVNITGTLNILLAARDAGVKRVVYAASSVRVRQSADAAESGNDDARSAVALCDWQTRGRDVCARVHATVRTLDGFSALF